MARVLSTIDNYFEWHFNTYGGDICRYYIQGEQRRGIMSAAFVDPESPLIGSFPKANHTAKIQLRTKISFISHLCWLDQRESVYFNTEV
jgi:alpha-glucuronidase